MLKPFAGIVLACFLVGCGGGGSTTPPPPPPTSATNSSPVGSGGGSVSTSLNGQTVKVTFPAGALATTTTMKLTVFVQAVLPTTFASLKRQTRSLPIGSSYLSGFVIDTGGVAIAQAPSITATLTAAVAAGTVQRLAASTGSSFVDIDTATSSGTSIANDGNVLYPGPTLVSANVVYTFYSVSSGSANAVPPATVAITGASTVNGGGSSTYTEAETANGFPYFGHTIAFGLDNPALGTISASSGAFTATTAAQIAGNVTATDSATGSTGKLAVQVLSSRPANVGDSLSYTGTISTTITNNAIATPAPSSPPVVGASPIPQPAPTPAPVTQSQAGNVTESVSVFAIPAAGQVTVASDEVDTFPLETLETKTTSTFGYQTSGTSTNVRLLTTLATDSNGSSYENDYTTTSGLLDVLPETTGSFGPNDASLTYKEIDPGITGASVTNQRVTASDGSYIDTLTNVDGTQNVATAAANFSGTYTVLNALFNLTYAAPTNDKIAIGFSSLQGPAFTAYGPVQTLNSFDWIPSSATTPYVETDSMQNSATIDKACAVPSKYGTIANLVTQTVTSIDALFGTLDQTTTKAFDLIGVGTVCIELSDTSKTYYDYSGQEGLALISYSSSGSQPFLVTSSTETLGLASAKIAGQPVATQSLHAGANAVISAPLTHVAIAALRNRFLHTVHQHRIQAALRLAASLHRSTGGIR